MYMDIYILHSMMVVSKARKQAKHSYRREGGFWYLGLDRLGALFSFLFLFLFLEYRSFASYKW